VGTFRPVRLVRRRAAAASRRSFSGGLLVSGVFIAAYGVAQFYRTPLWAYPNYWGGSVFAPIVVAIGVLMMVMSPFTIRRDPPVSPAAEGQPVRFPHEDVERPWTPADN
jgi:hypothetical protein